MGLGIEFWRAVTGRVASAPGMHHQKRDADDLLNHVNAEDKPVVREDWEPQRLTVLHVEDNPDQPHEWRPSQCRNLAVPPPHGPKNCVTNSSSSVRSPIKGPFFDTRIRQPQATHRPPTQSLIATTSICGAWGVDRVIRCRERGRLIRATRNCCEWASLLPSAIPSLSHILIGNSCDGVVSQFEHSDSSDSRRSCRPATVAEIQAPVQRP
jgi:hypothetical protein